MRAYASGKRRQKLLMSKTTEGNVCNYILLDIFQLSPMMHYYRHGDADITKYNDGVVQHLDKLE